MKKADANPLHSALRHLLRPLVRIVMQRGMAFEPFADIVRNVFVEVAQRDFALDGRKQTVSRISVLTGLTRKEVARQLGHPIAEDEEAAASYNRAARVVTGWIQDHPLEGTASGAAPLPVEGPGSFAEVVRRYSGDMPVRAVLDELRRVGAVRTRDGEVELLQRHYIPPLGDERKLVYLGDDAADLIATIGHNLGAEPGETRLQRKVFYDNVPTESLAEVRRIARERGERLLDDLARELSRHDRDVNPAKGGTGRVRIAVGVYFAEEPFGAEQNPAPQPRGARSRRTAGAASGQEAPRRVPRKRTDPGKRRP